MNADIHNKLISSLQKQPPFSFVPDSFLNWFEDSRIIKYAPGERLYRPDEISDTILVVLKGEVRLLGISKSSNEQVTLGLRGPGQIIGWVSLLRASSAEFVQASSDVLALSLSASGFIDIFKSNSEFASYFNSCSSLHESFLVAQSYSDSLPTLPSKFYSSPNDIDSNSKVFSASSSSDELPQLDQDWNWHLSSSHSSFPQPGSIIESLDQFDFFSSGLLLPIRFIGLPSKLDSSDTSYTPYTPELVTQDDISPVTDLTTLGILEDDLLDDDQRYPFVSGRGEINSILSVCQMIALFNNVPFRKDALKRVIEDQFRRNKGLSIELLGGLCEMLGFTSQLAEVSSQHISSIEPPALFILDDKPVVFYGIRKSEAIIASPEVGIYRVNLESLSSSFGERFRFVLPRRVASTPTSRFGWSWFTPLLKKYKKSLVLVFVSSLLAQLFGLAIPLLLQQIIDKVLNQGNLSSLNILGSAMLLMALFQGILQALRTYIFVDTTDRMDLTLGSAVIDKLLALPLTYFEKRPVGELSQRLGELNNIRSFLTGTALLSVLNIIFAVLYLVVMFLYSPLLSGVALSTFPLYVLLVFGVAPIYKSLIRKRAMAAARTQSHLIEVLGGIQTVKAQHFELTARWKWQDRYRNFVNEGFKSTALGATSGEIGTFLTSVSSLLVLWVGMWLVLKGEFSLGQLIAFRIISGNVTGPLLQLAGLYQGFQTVQLSIERLRDIIDQNPELQNDSSYDQIALPPIVGKVCFENISFRFGKVGPNQLDDVSVEIEPGKFVGIVGQSGSGKSTLMKLLPRLYDPDKGRILIDDYDISKVDLKSVRRQVGIVPQDSLLFEGTVADNISLNDPQATTETIIESARIACAHDFIMTLPDGYATPITEKGANLSGGQRQRIAIARTILSNPQLLVMDEATSALDFETERELCLNLQRWSKGRTVFFITHRLTTIRSADTILVMNQGRLVESGSHSHLVAMNGRYASLFRQQDSSAS